MTSLEHAGKWLEAGAVRLEPRPAVWDAVRARIAVVPVTAPEATPATRGTPAPRVVPFLRPSWVRVTALAAAASLVLGIGVWNYWARQEGERKVREAVALERYMNDYIERRQAEERTHRAVHVETPVQVTTPTVAVSGTAGRHTRARRTHHREYSQNPFVTLTDEPRIPYRPAELKAPEATK